MFCLFICFVLLSSLLIYATLLVEDQDSLDIPGKPGTHYVTRLALTNRDLLAFPFPELGLKAWATVAAMFSL